MAESKNIELLRLITAGSVDDGKSTLIGRLLYDSKSIFEDQLESLSTNTNEGINLANLTDGLKAEREQGITIDVAYRYFSTPKRRFILADTPGHVQYTRNMVTGASTANLAIILIDARQGVIEQTKRHSYIATRVRIPHLVVCINKMDLVDYSEEVYRKIHDDYAAFATKLWAKNIKFIPISALNGDNVVSLSKNMPWYQGAPLLQYLEEVHIANDRNFIDGRFPVQYVIRPRDDEHHDFRGYAGQVAGGVFKKGDRVVVLPSGRPSTIKAIYSSQKEVEEAFTPMSAIIELEDDIDISRGDVIVPERRTPNVKKDLKATICWMDEQPLLPNRKYLLKCGTNTVQAMLNVDSVLDIKTLERNPEATNLSLNEIGRVSIKTASPLVFDSYRLNRQTGSFVLIDPATNLTAAAGFISEPERQVGQSDYSDYMI